VRLGVLPGSDRYEGGFRQVSDSEPLGRLAGVREDLVGWWRLRVLVIVQANPDSEHLDRLRAARTELTKLEELLCGGHHPASP
jgi:hypothetical protein